MGPGLPVASVSPKLNDRDHSKCDGVKKAKNGGNRFLLCHSSHAIERASGPGYRRQTLHLLVNPPPRLIGNLYTHELFVNQRLMMILAGFAGILPPQPQMLSAPLVSENFTLNDCSKRSAPGEAGRILRHSSAGRRARRRRSQAFATRPTSSSGTATSGTARLSRSRPRSPSWLSA